MAKKSNKYLYFFVLQGYYTNEYKWEDLCQSLSWKEIRQDRRDYVKNEGGRYRIIERRVLNTEENNA